MLIVPVKIICIIIYIKVERYRYNNRTFSITSGSVRTQLGKELLCYLGKIAVWHFTELSNSVKFIVKTPRIFQSQRLIKPSANMKLFEASILCGVSEKPNGNCQCISHPVSDEKKQNL